MKYYNKTSIKILITIFLLFQINSITAKTIFVIGPGVKDNWHSDLKRTYNILKKRIGRQNIEIFPEVNIENERDIYASCIGNQDELSDELATKIVNDFIQKNRRSIEDLEIKNKIKDKQITKSKQNSENQTKEIIKTQQEKISLISYGQGAHVLVNALYKLKRKLEQKAQESTGFAYFLEDIINSDNIHSYETTPLPEILTSSSIYQDMQQLALNDKEETSSTISSFSIESVSSVQSYTPNEIVEEQFNIENTNKIIIDLSKPLENQLNKEQILLLQNKITPQNEQQSEELEMIKLMLKIKQLESQDEYHGLNPKLKLAGKITIAFFGFVGTTVPVIITGIVAPVITAIITTSL